ncbi:MAG: 3-deoxy-D-manno-octulosonic acid transferase [Flavobacteriales bacterium]
MAFIYSIGVRLYGLFVYLASFFNDKAQKWVEGRRDWRTELKLIPESENRIWVHCASLGEFEQALPIINELEQQNFQVLVSFFSPSGFEHVKDKKRHSPIVYLPIDSKRNAKDFIQLIKPRFALFVKYEFWYFYWSELKKSNIPFYLISAVFRRNQIFFKSYGSWYKRVLELPNHIFCQHINSVNLLNEFGIKNSSYTGDTRYDRVLALTENIDVNSALEKFSKNRKVIIAGSSWPIEEDLVIDYLNTRQDTYAIIAPHDVSNSHLKDITEKLNVPFVFYSKIDEFLHPDIRVVVVDTIGVLAKSYRYADIAIVGGGFTNALHNILEPAAHGIPVITGNYTTKYTEAEMLESAGGAIRINKDDFPVLMDNYFSDKELQIKMKEAAKLFVEKNAGATNKIIDYLTLKSKI